MKLQIILLSALLTIVSLGIHQSALAHEDDLESGNLKPRIGYMSELVAKQKLETYGVTNVTKLDLVGDQYVINATYNNKPIQLNMHAQTGLLTEKDTATQLPVAESAKYRVINSYQIQLERQELVKPELIQQIKAQ